MLSQLWEQGWDRLLEQAGGSEFFHEANPNKQETIKLMTTAFGSSLTYSELRVKEDQRHNLSQYN